MWISKLESKGSKIGGWKIFSNIRYLTEYFKNSDFKNLNYPQNRKVFRKVAKWNCKLSARTLESYCFPLSIFIGKHFPAFQENWKFSIDSFPWKAIGHTLVFGFETVIRPITTWHWSWKNQISNYKSQVLTKVFKIKSQQFLIFRIKRCQVF